MHNTATEHSILSNYAQSPLGQAIQKLSKTIPELLLRYDPATTVDDDDIVAQSADEVIARDFIKNLEYFLVQLTSLFNSFDGIELPRVDDLVRLVCQLKALPTDRIFLNLVETFQINNPLTYQVALAVFELITQIPNQLLQLMPFLHLEAIDDAFLAKKNTPELVIVALNELYDDYFESIFQFLNTGIKRYLESYFETTQVQSEVAKVSLLEVFISLEVERCKAQLIVMQTQCYQKLQQEFGRLESVVRNENEDPGHINKRLQCVRKSIELNRDLSHQFSELSNHYRSQSIRALFVTSDADLLKQAEADRQQGLDVSYLDGSLPDYVYYISSQPVQFGIIEIGMLIQRVIDDAQIELNEDQDKLLTLLEQKNRVEDQTIDSQPLLHQQSLDLMQHFNRSEAHRKYRDAILELYRKIEEMRQYGKKLPHNHHAQSQHIEQIGCSLVEAVDHLVMSNGSALPTPDAFQRFRNDFVFKAHHQDAILNQPLHAWQTIVANVLIGVFSLGIALGVELVRSKIKTGHASLFFNKSTAQKNIEALDEHVMQVVRH